MAGSPNYQRGDLGFELLKAALPDLRGKLTPDADLRALVWFRVGGTAEFLFEPKDAADLQYFLSHTPPDLPVMPIGLGSNLLIRDGGITGVVVRFPKSFAFISQLDEASFEIGVAAADVRVALTAGEAGIGGFSFLRGVPGAIGGALKMNAGAYGAEIKDIFVSAKGFDRAGKEEQFDKDAMDFAYRHTAVGDNVILTSCVLQGVAGRDPSALALEMKKITEARETSQPVKARTGGSTFKNPEGTSAWKLVDEAGCRGLTFGGAQVSPQHTNFLINLGSATAQDIESLGEEVRARVKAQSGIDLTWEIKRIGEKA